MPVDDFPGGGEQLDITVCVVASAPALRAGLQSLIGDIEGVAQVYGIGSLEEFESLSSSIDILVVTPDTSSSPDLVDVLDVEPAIALLVLIPDHQELVHIAPDLTGRAWGVLSLEASPEELEAAVRALAVGLLVGMPALVNSLFGISLASSSEQLVDPLTDREVEVLQLLAQGKANKQIALQLGISQHTVKFHISGIYTKLGVANRTAAVRRGVRQGLISL